MFEKLTSFANVEFDLYADGPIIVSSGKSNKTDPTVPDTTFMTGYIGKNHLEECYVIPGSSVKGVLRHHIQDYYITNDDEAEKLFGKINGVAQKSKIKFNDAYAVPETVLTSVRNSTKIDPNSQKPVNGSLNNMEVVNKGIFKAGFQIRNFTSKEIEAILMSLLDINEGSVRFGGKVSRGFGMMKVDNFLMSVNNGYDIDLKPKEPKLFTDIESALKYFRR